MEGYFVAVVVVGFLFACFLFGFVFQVFCGLLDTEIVFTRC